MSAKRTPRQKSSARKKEVQSAERQKFTERLSRSIPRFDMDELTDKLHFYGIIAAWLFLILDVFLVASLLTDWTGSIGEWIRTALIGRWGGGVVIFLLFGGYLSVAWIADMNIPQPVRQTAGTISLYMCISLLLGLTDMITASGGELSVLYAGSFGIALSGWSFENLGPLGTTLLGLSAIVCTLLLYSSKAQMERFFSALKNMFKRRESKHTESAVAGESRSEDADDCEPDDYTDDDEDLYIDEEPVEEEYIKSSVQKQPLLEEWDGTEYDALTDDLPVPDGLPGVDEMGDTGDLKLSVPVGRFPPPFEIYGREQDESDSISKETARPWGERIIASLAEFGVEAELAEILIGPTVIQFRIQPAAGVKVSRISSLANDLAMVLAVASLRVEAPIPGKPYVGIEIPNPKRRGITLRSVIEEDEYQNTDKSLPLPMGVTINGDPMIIGLEELPHLLVAGTTGSGKSVFVNSCIIGLCSMRRPDELKMVLVDPKRVEMAAYEKLPHILTPPVTDPKKAVHVLGWAIREMERRYSSFAEVRVRNLASYNELVLPKDRLPHIVIVVDELADLMMTAAKEVEEYICRLAQMARATGIHLMLATQRPSVNVITGLIKANIPARVAFTLPSMMDSRTIIDSGGAEKLLGKGDMLFLSTQNPKPIRIQSPWIDEASIERWLTYLVNMFGEPVYTDIDDQGDAPSGFESSCSFDDALLDEAVRVVITSGIASASGLQRRLRIGFTRAGRLVDMMEMAGIVGPSDGARAREILVDEDEAESILDGLRRVS